MQQIFENLDFHEYDKRLGLLLSRINSEKYGEGKYIHKKRKLNPKKRQRLKPTSVPRTIQTSNKTKTCTPHKQTILKKKQVIILLQIINLKIKVYGT